jgi:short-subunit dehydrogenase
MEMIYVNCLVPAEICRVFLPAFLQAKRGTLINIASSSAYQPLPYMAVYSASKAFMLNFSQAIAGELIGRKDHSVEIITVSPSGTATAFQKSAQVKVANLRSLLSPDFVATRILSALGGGSKAIDIGMAGKLMSVSARLLPRKTQLRLWEYLMKEMR